MAKKQESRKAPAATEVEKTRKPKSTSAKSTKSDSARAGKAETSRKQRGNGKTVKTEKSPKRVAGKPKKRTDGAGVTENAPYSDLAKYRMITTSDDVANSSGS